MVSLNPLKFDYYCYYCFKAGDGPKRALLEEVCEQCKLGDRVKFLGKLEHEKVRDVSSARDACIIVAESKL